MSNNYEQNCRKRENLADISFYITELEDACDINDLIDDGEDIEDIEDIEGFGWVDGIFD